MKSLSAILNHHCPESCKVLLMGMELLCFNLSVLAEKTDKVYLYNFVGVTGHHGMDTLPKVSRVSTREDQKVRSTESLACGREIL